jgi:hypothetical protein
MQKLMPDGKRKTMENEQTFNLSRLVGILSLVATISAFAATLLQQLAPEYAVFALALTAAIAAFTEKIQGR